MVGALPFVKSCHGRIFGEGSNNHVSVLKILKKKRCDVSKSLVAKYFFFRSKNVVLYFFKILQL